MFQLTNPVGGLGLTTGLMDASLLGRILKQVIVERKESGPLLQAYAEMRRDVFLNITNPTAMTNRKRLLGTDEETAREREEFFDKINKSDEPFIMGLVKTEMSLASS